MFTYDLSSQDTNAQTISKIRLQIGDNQLNDGPLPGGKNFEDEELIYFLTQEKNNVARAVCFALETLASRWATFSAHQSGPIREELQQVSRNYRLQAQSLRKQHGYSTAGQAFSVPAQRG